MFIYDQKMNSQHWYLTLKERNILTERLFCCSVYEYVSTHFDYPRATRCGGDIVTLLWFRLSLRVSVTL